MLNFDEELKKFHPILNVSDVERQIATEDMDDLMDMVKKYITNTQSSNDQTDYNSDILSQSQSIDKES